MASNLNILIAQASCRPLHPTTLASMHGPRGTDIRVGDQLDTLLGVMINKRDFMYRTDELI